MLSEILQEINETPTSSTVKSKPIIKEYSYMARKLAAENYRKNFTPSVKKLSSNGELFQQSEKILKDIQNIDGNSGKVEKMEISVLQERESETQKEIETQIDNTNTYDNTIITQTEELITDNPTQEDCFEEDLDISQIEEFESQQVQDMSVNEENIANVLATEIMNKWDTFSNVNTHIDIDNLLDKTDIPLVEIEDKKVCLLVNEMNS